MKVLIPQDIREAEAADAMSLSAAKAVDDVLSGKEPMYPVNSPKVSARAGGKEPRP